MDDKEKAENEGTLHDMEEGNDGEEGEFLGEDDIVEVIELDEGVDGEPLAVDMDDMELQEEDEDEEGAMGVEEEYRDDSAVTFSKHTGSVFCVSTDPKTSTLAVSGGEDDTAYVWSLTDGSVLFECTGHTDSVTCASFSHDSMYIASADMSGLIKVWKVDSKEEIWSFECSDLEWLEWHHGAHVLLAGTQDGETWMWKIPSGDCKTFQGHGSTCSNGTFLPDGKRACIGYDDGAVKIWDLKTGKHIYNISGTKDSHEGSVTCIDCHHDNNLVATGSTDVTAKLISSNTGKVLATLNCRSSNSEDAQEDDSVEVVAFHPSLPLLATATLAGVLTIWDVPTHVARQQCKHEAGITRLTWDPSSPLVYTTTLDGVTHLWDSRSAQRQAQWFGHTDEILDLSLTRDGSKLVTSSSDKTARVFNLMTPDR